MRPAHCCRSQPQAAPATCVPAKTPSPAPSYSAWPQPLLGHACHLASQIPGPSWVWFSHQGPSRLSINWNVSVSHVPGKVSAPCLKGRAHLRATSSVLPCHPSQPRPGASCHTNSAPLRALEGRHVRMPAPGGRCPGSPLPDPHGVLVDV